MLACHSTNCGPVYTWRLLFFFPPRSVTCVLPTQEKRNGIDQQEEEGRRGKP